MSEQKLPVSIELGAKASLEIKAEVPKASAGRLVDALTDIIRPFTESRGLKADQIRLQRAEVAIEIARLAKLRIDARKQEIKSVSNKILVPLIERASNEDISDRVMISRWANLLAAAATEDSIPPIYVQILSQMSGRQALTLENVMLNEYSDWYFPFRTFEDSFLDLDSGISRKFFLLDFRDIKFKNAKEVYMLICDHFNRPGGYLHYIFDEKNFDAQSEVPHLQGEYKAGEELDLEICCALGLLKKKILTSPRKSEGRAVR